MFCTTPLQRVQPAHAVGQIGCAEGKRPHDHGFRPRRAQQWHRRVPDAAIRGQHNATARSRDQTAHLAALAAAMTLFLEEI